MDGALHMLRADFDTPGQLAANFDSASKLKQDGRRVFNDKRVS